MAASLPSPPVPSAPAEPANNDIVAPAAVRPNPIASRPAKKRPVPIELTQLDPVAAVAEPAKKPKTATGSVAKSAALPSATTPISEIHHQDMCKTRAPRRGSKSATGKKSKRKSSPTSAPSFPVILMGMLSTPQNSKYITFLSDERRFVILDSAEFETELLPMHFETDSSNMYWNFTRMLEEWDFKAEMDDDYPGKDVYSHPDFKKGDWEGCFTITKPGSETTNVKESPPLKPLGMPPLPSVSKVKPQMETPSQSLAHLNASLSKHMSATEQSRLLCNRHGLLKDSSALQEMIQAQAQQNDASVLQAMLLQALQSNSPTIQAMMADVSSIQALMAAQQERSRMITAAVESLGHSMTPRTISPEFLQIQAALGGQSLDALTENFIKQSVERMMSRQMMMRQMGQDFGPM